MDRRACGRQRRRRRGIIVTSRQTLVGLTLLGLAVFLPGLGAYDLWNPDEPRYAEVAREMVDTGEFLVPHLSGLVYAEKPPLFFWSVATAAKLTGGMDEFAVRLPSALAATGATVLVYLIAALYFERRAALFSALIYLSCMKVLWQGRTGQIDMLLGFWVVLALYLWARGRGRRRFPWGFWVVTGLATLTKGPVGLLPPLLIVLAVSLWERDRAELSRLRIGRGLLLSIGVVLLWLVPAIWIGGQSYFEVIVLKQNATRYANPWGHVQPWYYYASVLPLDFFPWFFLLPGALLAGRRSFFGEERRGFRMVLLWVLLTLVFFSLSPGKRSVYVFQMYPALAILIGAGLETWERERRVKGAWFTLPLGLVGGLLVLAAVLLPPYLAEVQEADLFPSLAALTPFLVAGLGVLLIAGALGLLGRRIGRGVVILGIGMPFAALGLVFLVLPDFDLLKSGRPVGERLSEVAGQAPVGIFPAVEAGVLFYAERTAEPLCSEAELRSFLARPGALLVANLEMLHRVGGPPLRLEQEIRDVETDGWGLFRSADTLWQLAPAELATIDGTKPVKYGYPCDHR